jgi:hypothetical protein
LVLVADDFVVGRTVIAPSSGSIVSPKLVWRECGMMSGFEVDDHFPADRRCVGVTVSCLSSTPFAKCLSDPSGLVTITPSHAGEIMGLDRSGAEIWHLDCQLFELCEIIVLVVKVWRSDCRVSDLKAAQYIIKYIASQLTHLE